MEVFEHPSTLSDLKDVDVCQTLPFGALSPQQLRKLLYLPVELGSPDFLRLQQDCRSTPKGNYIASATLAELRITQVKLIPRLRSRPRNLEAVLELPNELLFQIFELLHPIDLYHIICTSKSLRRFLLDCRSLPVWEKAFLTHPKIPSPPTDVSFPKWVSLLFGPATCDKCGYPNVLVEFTYRKRVCQICMSEKYKLKDDFSKLVQEILPNYPKAQDDLWRLVRYTYRSSAFSYPSQYVRSMERRYFEEDVRTQAQKIKAFLLAIEAGHANAKEDYRAFKRKTADGTLVYNRHAIMCSQWAQSILSKLDGQHMDVIRGKFQDICRRQLLALGHDERDVFNIDINRYLYAYCKRTNPSRFARKGYRHHLPALEKMVLSKKEARLAVECERRRRARQEQALSFYQDMTSTHIDPAHWEHLPSIDELPFFADYFRIDPEPLGEQSIPVDPTRSAVLAFVYQWIGEKRAHLCEILAKTQPELHRVSQPAPGDVLTLATAVFLCRPRPSLCPALIGWEAVGPHLDLRCASTSEKGGFQFCIHGYRTVTQLLDLLNLDPLVTKAKDLDKLNARFICNTSSTYVPVMTWRECVNHASQVQPPMTDPPTLTFSVLTEAATKSVLFHEVPYPYPGDKVWSCRRCTEYLNNPATRKVIISHLKSTHQISTPPIENVDFFHRQLRIPDERKRFMISQKDDTLFRCAICTSRSNLRIWARVALLKHLKDKHKISEPIQGVDFSAILVLKK